MLRDVLDMPSEVRHVLAPSKEDYRECHIDKLLRMMRKVAIIEGEASRAQGEIIDTVKREFELNIEQPAHW
jgi:hypothetical protein